jgi:hypothetical protein
VPYVRTVKTKSGAAVQFVYLSRDIEHLGPAHDEAELEALKAGARQRGSWSPAWALSLRAAGRCRSPPRAGAPAGRLERAYLVLGHAISGRQLAHDLFRPVLLPGSQVDVRAFLPATRAARLSNVELVIQVPIADPPDPEGRIRISAAVAGERPAKALSVVFAVRRDDEGSGVSPDLPSLGGKMVGQRDHIAV